MSRILLRLFFYLYSLTTNTILIQSSQSNNPFCILNYILQKFFLISIAKYFF